MSPMSRLPSVRAAAATALLLAAPTALAQEPQAEPLPPLPTPTAAPPERAPGDASPAGALTDADLGLAGDGGAPPASPSSEPPAPRPRALSGKEFRPTLKGSAGFQYAQAHGVPITGGRLRLGVGAQNDSSAYYAVLSVLYGGTAEGLRTWDVRGSISGDLLRTGILRLGLDLEMGYLVVRRVTVDSRMWALGLGAGVHASVDVYAFGPRDDHAVFLEGKLDAHLHFGNAFVWGPSVFVGIRY
ncbi:MAG: hypothetical protein KIS78_29200 [Labilithrix sp.]|nr:hypothetical protein [Labilithrix sp.]